MTSGCLAQILRIRPVVHDVAIGAEFDGRPGFIILTDQGRDVGGPVHFEGPKVC